VHYNFKEDSLLNCKFLLHIGRTLAWVFGINFLVALPALAKCTVGVYKATDERFLSITLTEKAYNLLRSDGHFELFNPAAPESSCSDSSIFYEDEEWNLMETNIFKTRFASADAILSGQLIMRTDASSNTPLVVYAHGSESTGWLNTAWEPYQLLARGVSVFVYDKRGTGESTGKYSQNFPILAADLVAASIEAKRLAENRYGRFGLIGLSQGGWVAPLASNEAQADFIAIGYGLVSDFTEEDADQVDLELTKLGYGDREKSIAKQITNTTARMIKSQYRDGLDDLIKIKEEYAQEEWLWKIKGSYTGVLISSDPDKLLTEGIPFFDSLNVDWSVDPIANVKAVEAEQYWALAEKDQEAPIDKTVVRLKAIKAGGNKITLRIFPNADHGMWIVGESKIAKGYYDSQADFAKGKQKLNYGASWVIE